MSFRFSPVAASLRIRFGVALLVAIAFAMIAQAQIPGRNVNMVSGDGWPDGDPFLQRQNEPSMAASTRNPLHLLAGSNDYRTVDLPGLPGDEIGDAWLGLYKSVDGGQRWTSNLLPGYPQDLSAEGLASPLKGFQAGADPVVRAGTNGLFYYAGLVFDRTPNGKSGIFVSRFIDNNNKEAGDSVAYLGAALVAHDPGTTGNFLDKPWMTVDIPRGNTRCRIVTPGEKGPITQRVPAGNVYVAYALKSVAAGVQRFDIMFTASQDCGASWTPPVRVSRPEDRLNQGVTLSIAPNTGNVYIAWRLFDLNGDGDSIMTAVFEPGTKKFKTAKAARKFPKKPGKKPLDPAKVFKRGGLSEALNADTVAPLDQGTSVAAQAFRTNAYPTLATDGAGRAYMAWTERGFAPGNSDLSTGDARILLSTSANGETWTAPQVVSNESARGHQLMPSLAFAGGKLMLVFYDLRETRSQVFSEHIDDLTAIALSNPKKRHTIDLRAAMASPGANPVFEGSVRVSDYLMGTRAETGLIEQLQVNPPNLPMFMLGTAPFIGDYVDVAASPAFVRDAAGKWTFNTQAGSAAPVFHAAWTDNRDVRPPFDGDWTKYEPPFFAGQSPLDPSRTVPICNPATSRAGSRNQNIYTARITGGILVGSPGNTKTLSTDLQRAFVVFAQNATADPKTFRFTILGQPVGGRASFEQFPLPPFTAASPAPRTVIDATVPPRSTASRTVYVTSSDPHAPVSIDVSEIDAPGAPTETVGGLEGLIMLNPDIDNPDIDNPDIDNPDIDNPDIDNAEVYNPDIDNPDIDNPDIDNPDIDNPDIDNPDIDNIRVANPDIDNPDIDNPDIDNPDIDNPDIDNPDIDNPDIDNGAVTDITWSMRNTGNTTAAYNVNVFLAQAQVPQGVKLQLVLHKTYKTPVVQGCALKFETQNVLVANIADPNLITALGGTLSNPNDSDSKNATLWLAPGEIGKVTLRVYDDDVSNNVIVDGASIDPALVPEEDVSILAQQQPVDSEDADTGTTEPDVVTTVATTGALAILNEPLRFTAGVPSPVRVRTTDTLGAVLPGVPITIALQNNPTGAALSGAAAAVTNALGVASFPLVSIDKPGAGYTITATATGPGGVASIESLPFSVFESCVASGNAPIRHYNVDGPASPDEPKFIQAGVDWTNNGPDDVALASSNGVVYVMPGFKGQFGLPGSSVGYLFATGTGAGGATGMAVGDFTGDGGIDIAVAKDGASPRIHIVPLTNGMPAAAPYGVPLSATPRGLVARNFGGSGHIDLATIDGLTVRVLINNGSGGFTSLVPFGTLVAPTAIIAADIDADADSDLIVADAVGPVGVLRVFRNDVGLWTTLPAINVGDTPAAIVAGDFGADGLADLAVAHWGTGDLWILNGDGTGAFAATTTVALGFSAGGITAGDYDSDGVLDVAITNPAADSLHLLFGDMSPGYELTNPQVFATGNGPSEVVTSDFNGDGRPDIALANASVGQPFSTMSVLLGSCGAPTADLVVTLSEGADPVTGLTNIAYTVTVTNQGPFPATNVTVTNGLQTSLPASFLGAVASQGTCSAAGAQAASCNLGSIMPGDSASVDFTFVAPSAGLLAANATASAAEIDLLPANNVQRQTTTVVAVPDTFFVGNTNDSGPGSLRAAIEMANVASNADAINFTIPGASPATPAVIVLNSPLPLLTTGMSIDGTSQPGYDGKPVIEVTPASANIPGSIGFQLYGSNIIIRGLSVTRFDQGIFAFQTTTGNHVLDNYIGTTRALEASRGNIIGVVWRSDNGGITQNVISANLGDGILLHQGASTNLVNTNRIGTTDDGLAALPNGGNGATLYDGATQNIFEGNTISGNALWGVEIQHSGALAPVTGTDFRGNVIGLAANGSLLGFAGGDISGETSYGFVTNFGPAQRGNRLGGIRVKNAPGTVIGQITWANVISGNTGPGVLVETTVAPAPVIRNNIIGLDISGAKARGNTTDGIQIASADVSIGSLSPGDTNVISGNIRNGIVTLDGAGGITVVGNRIGTDLTGTAITDSDGLPLGNGKLTSPDPGCCHAGVFINTSGNRIDGNLISGNMIGVRSSAPPGSANLIVDNKIGTNIAGAFVLSNTVGVFLAGDHGTQISGNRITGSYEQAVLVAEGSTGALIGGAGLLGNSISGNARGIVVGYDASATDTGIRITNNDVSDNGAIGIDLANDGNTFNDADDVDTGPNGLQNAPVFINATNNGSVMEVAGSLDSTPSTAFQVDIYWSGHCTLGGVLLVRSRSVSTNASGFAVFETTFSAPPARGGFITMTATDPSGSTSEFSPCRSINEDMTVDGQAGGTANGNSVTAGGLPPTNTGVMLNPGELVLITATGSIYNASPAAAPNGPWTPDGDGSQEGDATFLVPGMARYALVARIGGGAWQLLGDGSTMISSATGGLLELAVNDSDYDDNSGSWSTRVRRSPPVF